VTIPPEAPLEGLKIKDLSVGGRKEDARKREMSSSLDSWMQRIEGRNDSTAALKSSRLRRLPRPQTFQQEIENLDNIKIRKMTRKEVRRNKK
jgi:hypothetical protein